MVWGGSYDNMEHYSVTCVKLAPIVPVFTALPLFSSQNVYTVLYPEQTCLTYNPDINALMFTARGHTGVVGTSNDICSATSINRGSSFTYGVSVGPNQGYNRYPSGDIYNPAGNTNPANAFKAFAAPITNGSTWIGNNFATNTWANNHLYTETMGSVLGNDVMCALNIQSDNVAHGVSLDNSSDYLDCIPYIYRGIFNSAIGGFNWDTTRLAQPFFKSPSSLKYYALARGNMAFSPDGAVGYAVYVGSDARAPLNDLTGYQPIVYKTINSGIDWVRMDMLNLKNHPLISQYIWPKRAGGGTQPNFSESDIVVDQDGNLHIIALCKGTFSTHPDSLAYSYTWENGAIFDISNI
ncbi:MAG: hypothetical protein CVU06_16410, partial [Bacteroidetes bacterium HGW-Bacteroidetes-22]